MHWRGSSILAESSSCMNTANTARVRCLHRPPRFSRPVLALLCRARPSSYPLLSPAESHLRLRRRCNIRVRCDSLPPPNSRFARRARPVGDPGRLPGPVSSRLSSFQPKLVPRGARASPPGGPRATGLARHAHASPSPARPGVRARTYRLPPGVPGWLRAGGPEARAGRPAILTRRPAPARASGASRKSQIRNGRGWRGSTACFEVRPAGEPAASMPERPGQLATNGRRACRCGPPAGHRRPAGPTPRRSRPASHRRPAARRAPRPCALAPSRRVTASHNPSHNLSLSPIRVQIPRHGPRHGPSPSPSHGPSPGSRLNLKTERPVPAESFPRPVESATSDNPIRVCISVRHQS
jgi:hypothetical protein